LYEVRFSREFSEEYSKLKKRAESGRGEARYLVKIIDKGIAKLKRDREAGKRIPRRLIPRGYAVKYGVTNLWKLNLDRYWRMIYTIVGDEVRLVSIIIEVLNHKKYDIKFGYRTT
jgi:mRNA-degrading endonuclease RelE of RelBE toxin-antitoxin system